jgi:hypothetical protein
MRVSRLRAFVYPPPVPNARAGLLVPLALACAGAPPPLPAGVGTRPALGDPLELLIAKLPHAEAAGPRVALEELRVLEVEREPWTSLDPAHAAGAPGRVAVIAGRRCAQREGLGVARAERSSWFLLTAGRVVAFDHDAFVGGCVSLPVFEPASREDAPIERQLVRYVTQRWPDDAVAAEERLERGLALLARGRADDALAELQALDREIAELERRERESTSEGRAASDGEAAWREEADRLRPLRAQLHHALRGSRAEEGPR